MYTPFMLRNIFAVLIYIFLHTSFMLPISNGIINHILSSWIFSIEAKHILKVVNVILAIKTNDPAHLIYLISVIWLINIKKIGKI